MITENVVLMKMARESLKGKWGLAIGTFVVYMLILGCVMSPARFFPPSGLLSLIFCGPLAEGIAIFSLALSRNQNAEIGQIFKGFTIFGTALGAYLLMVLFVFLWSLLLVIPGIIAALSYSMTFYILADNPSMGAKQALDKSKMMMNGYKWKYFCLLFRFFGWFVLCLLTCGVGFLWLIPYINISTAKFYDDIKDLPVKIENSENS